jgi:hypothetical protein
VWANERLVHLLGAARTVKRTGLWKGRLERARRQRHAAIAANQFELLVSGGAI